MLLGDLLHEQQRRRWKPTRLGNPLIGHSAIRICAIARFTLKDNETTEFNLITSPRRNYEGGEPRKGTQGDTTGACLDADGTKGNEALDSRRLKKSWQPLAFLKNSPRPLREKAGPHLRTVPSNRSPDCGTARARCQSTSRSASRKLPQRFLAPETRPSLDATTQFVPHACLREPCLARPMSGTSSPPGTPRVAPPPGAGGWRADNYPPREFCPEK